MTCLHVIPFVYKKDKEEGTKVALEIAIAASAEDESNIGILFLRRANNDDAADDPTSVRDSSDIERLVRTMVGSPIPACVIKSLDRHGNNLKSGPTEWSVVPAEVFERLKSIFTMRGADATQWFKESASLKYFVNEFCRAYPAVVSTPNVLVTMTIPGNGKQGGKKATSIDIFHGRLVLKQYFSEDSYRKLAIQPPPPQMGPLGDGGEGGDQPAVGHNSSALISSGKGKKIKIKTQKNQKDNTTHPNPKPGPAMAMATASGSPKFAPPQMEPEGGGDAQP